MKRESHGSALLTPGAVSRLADARATLQRARAGGDKALSRRRAGEAEVKRLEALAEETARALKAARERFAADQPVAEAWGSVLAFAEADVPVAEKEVVLAEAKDRLARFRKEHSEGGDERERASLEEAVGHAEKALEATATSKSHKALGQQAAEAERQLEKVRKADAERNRAALIERKLAQLSAASAKKIQERKGWSEREKSLGEEIARLDGERKRLETEHRQLSARG